MTDTRIQVAVVDDDASCLRAMERLLRTAGFLPRVYSSGEAFLRDHPATPPDWLILDVRLGTMTGFDVVLHLAAEGFLIPVVFMTAHDDPETRRMAEELGCAAYLRKPFTAQALFDAIQHTTPPGPSAQQDWRTTDQP